jgi:hypothetical protein
MVIRSTVKPYEKSPAEGSEDRRGTGPSAERLAPQPGISQQPNGAGKPQAGQPDASAPAVANYRLAIDDFAGLDQSSLRLTSNGNEVPVSPDGFVELPLEIGASHQLAAEAKRAGRPVIWTQTVVPTLDNEAEPMIAKL